ncbi:hypothetical protein [uncultured Rubinisphaera sp.]|mgnify:CR=1 FL=1|uniref:hypothetical protein n=1 Tax=uncultured Rubinisphaera sp. TaxID=1678686 RepID=UPI0030DBD619
MMNRPEPPSGHQFRIEENDSGTTLAWKHRPDDPLRFLLGFYYLIMGAIICVDILILEPIQSRVLAREWIITALIVFFIILPICLLLAYLFLKKNRFERITLNDQELIFQEGKGPISFINFHWMGKKRHNFNPISFVFSKAKSYSFNRSDIDRIILEGFGQQQRLRFDDGAIRVEIGEYLREPEREWLFEQIQQWKRTV